MIEKTLIYNTRLVCLWMLHQGFLETVKILKQNQKA